MPTKDEIVRDLVDWHFEVDPDMTKVYRFLAPAEDDFHEPIKLLEVSPAIAYAGSVMPFKFGPTDEMPYPLVIATITPEEMEQIERREISLPEGWSQAERQDYTTLSPQRVRPKNGAK